MLSADGGGKKAPGNPPYPRAMFEALTSTAKSAKTHYSGEEKNTKSSAAYKALLQVWFPDGSYQKMAAKPDTTAKELCNKIRRPLTTHKFKLAMVKEGLGNVSLFPPYFLPYSMPHQPE